MCFRSLICHHADRVKFLAVPTTIGVVVREKLGLVIIFGSALRYRSKMAVLHSIFHIKHPIVPQYSFSEVLAIEASDRGSNHFSSLSNGNRNFLFICGSAQRGRLALREATSLGAKNLITAAADSANCRVVSDEDHARRDVRRKALEEAETADDNHAVHALAPRERDKSTDNAHFVFGPFVWIFGFLSCDFANGHRPTSYQHRCINMMHALTSKYRNIFISIDKLLKAEPKRLQGPNNLQTFQ